MASVPYHQVLSLGNHMAGANFSAQLSTDHVYNLPLDPDPSVPLHHGNVLERDQSGIRTE